MDVSVEKPGSPGDVLEHFGKKGMKWGVRNAKRGGSQVRSASKAVGRTKGGKLAKASGRRVDNALFELTKRSNAVTRAITTNASKGYRKELPSIKAKHGAYGKLRNRAKHPFSPEAKAYRADSKKSYLKHLEASANSLTNIRGTRQYTLSEKGTPNTSQYFWKVQTQAVNHAAADGSFTVRPVFDDEGWIVDIELVEDDIAQTMDRGHNFLTHMGIET